MQHRSLTQACARTIAGLFIGALFAAAPGAFADEVSSFNQNVTNSTQIGSNSSLQQTSAQPSSGGAKSFLSGMAGKAGDVVVSALNMIGVRYRWGGNSPDSGLDCSGFVRYVFQDTLGMSLPRRAEEMSRVGEKVSMSNLKPGDLVFFNTMRRTFSHVGIYIGDNKFVHSPSTGSTVRVDDLDNGYWEKRFTGARRIESEFPMKADDLRQRVRATIGDETATTDARRQTAGSKNPVTERRQGFLFWCARCASGKRIGSRRRPEPLSAAARRVSRALGRSCYAAATPRAAASLRCSSGMMRATASSPARIAALRWLKSLPPIAARFGRITTSAYLSSS